MRKSTYSTYSVSNQRSWLKWVGAAFVFGAFISLLWYATSNKNALMQDEDDLELVLPLSGPVKVRAADPGGMEVENRDKQVFDLLDSSSEEGVEGETLCESDEGDMVCNKVLPKVTALSADPAAVAAAEAAAKMQPKSADIAMLIQGYKPENTSATDSENVNSNITKSEVVSVIPVQKMVINKEKSAEPFANKESIEAEKGGIKTEKSTPKENLANQTVAMPKTTAKSEAANSKVVELPKGIEVIAKEKLYTGGAWGVQLASYKSLENADTGSKILLKKFPEILSPLTYVTEKVDIEGKGRFYRVQFIGLKDKESAKKACDSLKAKGQGCWYVSR
mgnify:CR=1 FL=1|tara:strand:+ start:10802 stop:11806 length:1005 start_codon:yes stop_codon:yes gene_type:complete